MHFRKINTLLGWIVFIISAIVYLKTCEPTVSFWDCGEFIACAYKLEVGHQPGAPLFLLLGRLSSLFAGNNTALVAKMINSLSALTSAFSIMFLFWTITLLARKIPNKLSQNSSLHNLLIFGSGLTGALACAFSDTFWFSAVEGEVYATSSLFTAIVFWAILKWEASVDSSATGSSSTGKDKADRWIILIAYLMGLSIGVHLLNLLTIPALVLIYYFKKYPFTRRGLLFSVLISFVILGFVVFAFIPGVVRLAAWFDLLFVNGFGFTVNSGAIFYLACLFLTIFLLLRYSHRHEKTLMNRIILTFMVLLIGYSSYIVLSIRADANPPINLNKVNNPFSLLLYINREQYVIRPVLYGPYYNAPVTGYKSRYTFVPVDGKYIKTELNPKYIYDKQYMTFFPRMSSAEQQDIAAYKQWAGIKGKTPTFSENLRFFFKYQVGYMYFRYFMWNFAGRQTENQGKGDILNGNWISGIPMLDELRLGPQDNYPQTLMTNKGRNTYYLLPLMLGLIGLIYHFKATRKDFTVVLFFFILTGIAIVIYLNEIPVTPRERDYVVGGSFYVFCIWIGLGVLGSMDYLLRKTHIKSGIVTALLICFLFIPALMAKENLDDHDRSNRYVAKDFAYDCLNSCAPNALLFTNADNDTYPLWYIQEVEGIRTDVRVVLAPFLIADWYIQQLAVWRNDTPPVPFTIGPDKYASGKLNYVPYYKRTDQHAKLKDVIEFLKSDDPRTMVRTTDNSRINYYPTNRFTLPSTSDISDTEFIVSNKALTKNEIAILDIIATNNWQRPVYFLSTQVPKELGLLDYLEMDGFAYRLVPGKYNSDENIDVGSIDADKLYDNLMNKFKWGNMNNPQIFMDYNSIRTTSVLGMRTCFARLAEEYIKSGNSEKAIRVLDRCMELMPKEVVPYDAFTLQIISVYYNAGEKIKAMEIVNQYEQILHQELNYYRSLPNSQAKILEYEMRYDEYVLKQLETIKRPG
jgi:tetratricopeptide (TPR) repeat protein